MADILFLAPQPFYQERGTPIAIDFALQALEMDGHRIDLITYPEGEPRTYNNVQHYRVMKVPGIKNIGPGFSWKKCVYSFLMIFTALRFALTRRYHLVHAVEEACFIAFLLKIVLRLRYVYDMDSSLAQQLIEKKPALKHASCVFNWFEGLVIRQAFAIIAVCPALVELAKENKARRVLLLQDISFFSNCQPGDSITNLKNYVKESVPMLLYVGNLESYQGVDILLEGFALALSDRIKAVLFFIGGQERDMAAYKKKTANLGITNETFFLGPRPLKEIGGYLTQADILVSPRIRGVNTPMKIYTYLSAGKALLATSIISHTQVLNNTSAYLVDPSPQGIATGIKQLCSDPDLRNRLGREGKRKAEKEHSFSLFCDRLKTFYQTLITDYYNKCV